LGTYKEQEDYYYYCALERNKEGNNSGEIVAEEGLT